MERQIKFSKIFYMPIIIIVSQLIETILKKFVQVFLARNAIRHFKGKKIKVRGRKSKRGIILISIIFAATNVLVSRTHILQIPITGTSHHPTRMKVDWKNWRIHSTLICYHRGNTFSGTMSSQITFFCTRSFHEKNIGISRVLLLSLKDERFSR